MVGIIVIIALVVVFLVSYFSFRYLKGKWGKKRVMVINVMLIALAMVFFLVDGYKNNIPGITIAMALIAYVIYKYKTERYLPS